jgi:hypothetical protein
MIHVEKADSFPYFSLREESKSSKPISVFSEFAIGRRPGSLKPPSHVLARGPRVLCTATSRQVFTIFDHNPTIIQKTCQDLSPGSGIVQLVGVLSVIFPRSNRARSQTKLHDDHTYKNAKVSPN